MIQFLFIYDSVCINYWHYYFAITGIPFDIRDSDEKVWVFFSQFAIKWWASSFIPKSWLL